jgi:hypothetical protein
MQLTNITELSPASLINAVITVQGLQSIFLFLVPPLLALLMMLGAMPVLMALESLVALIDFGPKIKAAQAANDHLMKAFFNMHDFSSFMKVFIVVAVIPGIGEEFFFRGILMRFAKQKSSNMIFPILFTSVVFAYSHSNIYGFVSILLAGILLAVIYNLTGSIWCGVIAHMLFNGSQIILAYFGNSSSAVKAFMDSNTVPYYLVAAGLLVFSGSLYLLWKNRTPLPENWTNDYAPGETRE